MPDLAFVLVKQAVSPDPDRVVASARAGGLSLTALPSADGMLTFELADGATMIASLMPAPYPGAAQEPVGPTSPPPEQVAAASAHFIVTALDLTGTARERDTTMAILTAAVIENVDAVGAKLGHGAVFHQAGFFAEMAMRAAKEHEPLPPELAIDVTTARESATRMSFLTHNMDRYGREEFYVTCPIEGTGAVSFVYALSRGMLLDPDLQLPTGDTVGRSAQEKVVVQRVADPAGRGGQVIRLDLP